ncbi:dimethyladenosine transferase 2, mitochondrial isoform X2 [Phymastichus coffea]|uniref:dimethyladenosine transferase 2, mitochondrial isoform X2 n=1 Tax=Phymastichus coffea TaxID=108790 RepID=UPI00273A7BE1|nr:dimethyladenosine transferase 2, mitochondrial isoform X2 [Phymastichus coffea]
MIPGLGFLTTELLKAGIPQIHLYEMNKSFYMPGGPLSVLIDQHPNKLKLYPLNFSKVWKLLMRDEFCETREVEEYFAHIPYSQWKSKTYMQVIDFSPTRKPITLIMYNFFKQTHLFERGRPCFYIGAPTPAWHNLLDINGRFYSQYSVMFNLFFDIKHLGDFPRESFIPWPREKYWKLDNLDIPIHIVKLEPKKDVFDILTKDDLKSFWFFLKYCLKTRRNKVLAEFEKLVPGSGIKLIKQDCGILTTFKELSPQKLLEIFKMYRSWPEYDEVMFNPRLSIEEKKNTEKLEEDDFVEEFEQELEDNDNQALSTEDKQGNG